ncbi:hypothetical protein [Bordetella genomosp. 1]|uniref:Uncharacterized protein n=1 Tax=Bordetella genomosp. 1 TaxID=1395607 RepID=A0ABX4EXK5_9BORD|nr:hypothetical protein [Bordetella genomosp. 1]OZI63808.1 hypothetical protein CAL27_14480 [Bordetella genomosp. 1]
MTSHANTPGKAVSTGAPAPAPDEVSINAKVLPPRGPVDVPRMPPPIAKRAVDAAGSESKPVEDPTPESNWADNAQPQPYAKNARSSIF